MKALLVYQLKHYALTYRYTAPLLVHILLVVFLYGVVPNPVMESYSFTSTLLFLISAWLCFGFIDSEQETQQLIAAIHSRSVSSYYWSKLLFIWLFTMPAAFFTLLYPAIFGKFDRAPRITELAVAAGSHLILSLLGISIAAWFTSKWFPKLMHAIAGLFLVISLALAGTGITAALPYEWKWMTLLLPPVRFTMDMMSGYETAGVWGLIAGLALPLLYASILLLLFVCRMARKLF